MGTKTLIPSSGEFEYKWRSYDDVYQETQALANAILRQQLANSVTDPDFQRTLKVVGICSVNRAEWLITDLASNLIDVTSVPLYETLGDETLNLILEQTEMVTLFGSDVCLETILRTIDPKKKCHLKRVITFDDNVSGALTGAAQNKNVEIIKFSDLIKT